MAVTVSQTIYDMILHELHITFTPDESTRARLQHEIADGMAWIREYCDPDANFEPGGKFAALLKEYVLRAESGAVSTFADDFAKDVRSHRIAFDVEGYAEAMEYGDA